MANHIHTAAVIGGGIAGPVTAMALRRAGIDATVYEAYPRRAEGLGGTLALAPNGVAALEIIDAADAVRAIAQPLARMTMTIGAKRVDLPQLPDAEPLQQVHRTELYRVLHDQAVGEGVRFEYGKRLVDVREEPDAATVVFEDGTSARADVVIGADGVHSTVRRLIDPDAPAAGYTGLLGFEGVADYEPPVPADAINFTFGKNAYYLHWREPGGGTRFGMNLPRRRPMSSTEARAVPREEWLKVLADTYGQDDPGGELLRTLRPGSFQTVGALHIMPRVPHWHRGRMVLVGDSVHAPSNSSGQGASLAIESAIQLARCLRDVGDVPAAFAAYERLRRGRVEGIAKRASKINHAKSPGPVARAIMPVLMPVMFKVMNVAKTQAAEQRYRIDWDTPIPATVS
jgi:2-polyprenyl-6-methoxyphenol hydroxylase-like FAD-dependent oxidoreductase